MKVGISTACFYLREFTEDAIKSIGKMGIKYAEIFFSSMQEYEEDYIKKLKVICDDYDVKIHSVHPLPIQFEPQLFSYHERQYGDSFKIYKKVLKSAEILGASVYVFHGGVNIKPAVKRRTNFEFFGNRVDVIADAAKDYGVKFAYENVHWCNFNYPGFAQMLIDNTKTDNLYFNLDLKQAAQSGYDACEYISAMGDRLINIHACDYTISEEKGVYPCIPFTGKTDWVQLKEILKDFKEFMMLEIYNGDYTDYHELKRVYLQLKEYFEV